MFTNEERTRHYGVRVGDTVSQKIGNDVIVYGVVVGYPMDNNGVYVNDADGRKGKKWVAERCRIIQKIEDKMTTIDYLYRNKYHLADAIQFVLNDIRYLRKLNKDRNTNDILLINEKKPTEENLMDEELVQRFIELYRILCSTPYTLHPDLSHQEYQKLIEEKMRELGIDYEDDTLIKVAV